MGIRIWSTLWVESCTHYTTRASQNFGYDSFWLNIHQKNLHMPTRRGVVNSSPATTTTRAAHPLQHRAQPNVAANSGRARWVPETGAGPIVLARRRLLPCCCLRHRRRLLPCCCYRRLLRCCCYLLIGGDMLAAVLPVFWLFLVVVGQLASCWAL